MFGGCEAGMNETAGFVSEVHRSADPSPSCRVCGCLMTALGGCQAIRMPHQRLDGENWMLRCIDWKLTLWRCLSCGTTTQPS